MNWSLFIFDVVLTYASASALLWPCEKVEKLGAIIGRGAFFAFVLSATVKLLSTDMSHFHESLAAASLLVPLWLRPRMGLVLTASLGARALWFGQTSISLILIPTLVGFTVSVFMHRNALASLRRTLYAAAFFGAFGWLIPSMISRSMGPSSMLESEHFQVAGLSLMGLACILFVIAERQLCRPGGTADPFEPPEGLATHGIYAKVRNPIQIAECLFVLSVALLTKNMFALVYAVGFTATLVGPVRLSEERHLAARFGETYVSYKQRVPAYIPKLW